MVFLLLCALTQLFFLLQPSHRAVGPELLRNGDFGDGFSGWQAMRARRVATPGDRLELVLENGSRRTSALIEQALDPEIRGPVLLEAVARVEAVVPGSDGWHNARAALVGYDAAGRGRYDVPHLLFELTGDSGWRRFSEVLVLDLEPVEFRLEVALYHATGRLFVRDLSLHRAEPLAGHTWGRGLLLALWGAAFAELALAAVVAVRERPVRAIPALLLALVLAGVVMPKGWLMELESSVQQLAARSGLSLPRSGDVAAGINELLPQRLSVAKLGHLVGFALLGLVLLWDARRPWRRVGVLALAMLCSEVLQHFVPQRHPRLGDLLIDALGAAFGGGIALAGGRLRQRFRSAAAG